MSQGSLVCDPSEGIWYSCTVLANVWLCGLSLPLIHNIHEYYPTNFGACWPAKVAPCRRRIRYGATRDIARQQPSRPTVVTAVTPRQRKSTSDLSQDLLGVEALLTWFSSDICRDAAWRSVTSIVWPSIRSAIVTRRRSVGGVTGGWIWMSRRAVVARIRSPGKANRLFQCFLLRNADFLTQMPAFAWSELSDHGFQNNLRYSIYNQENANFFRGSLLE